MLFKISQFSISYKDNKLDTKITDIQIPKLVYKNVTFIYKPNYDKCYIKRENGNFV